MLQEVKSDVVVLFCSTPLIGYTSRHGRLELAVYGREHPRYAAWSCHGFKAGIKRLPSQR